VESLPESLAYAGDGTWDMPTCHCARRCRRGYKLQQRHKVSDGVAACGISTKKRLFTHGGNLADKKKEDVSLSIKENRHRCVDPLIV